MKTTAVLVDVCGDVVDFADLIGRSGTLYLSSDNSNNYFAAEGSDWLAFRRKHVTHKNGQIRIRSVLGNTFVFVEK